MSDERKTEEVNIVHVYEKKIWIESDFCGGKHVMVQHCDGKHDPFCYCSFYYDYAYTDNCSITHAAEQMAISLGAKHPVEKRYR